MPGTGGRDQYTLLGLKVATPNVPKWHIDYLELKLLKKQPVQEEHSTSPLSPEIRK